ncbi:ectoine/hydroxyectoine ABC transporter permease subunit EhuD [Bradyrhizobium sp. NBAIM01]|uniref:ectoine/hydroxyectoine ABC transporter permease subunit EhuD n=1 Tax=Bradyrhizobium sp. NBAIM01 TaxID=2793818 RepID=UPI001CD22815|nr:ectoine/hydroxyectoine ABC transporter permease subunit EhuD [Bradyrhizobium sp. NBAIM01]
MSDVFDWGFAWSILPLLASGALVTFQSTVIGFVLALAIGLPLALGRRSRSFLLFIPATAVIEFIRSTPLLIQLYFIFFVGPQFGIKLSPLMAGLLAIGLYYGCFIAEVYRSGIDAVPRGQWEAVMALNIGRWRAYRAIILPQAIPPMIPALGNYLIDIFKATPILSVITVLEMMTRAKMIGSESFRYTEPMTIVGAFFLIMTLGASFLVRRLERLLGEVRSKTPAGLTGV